MCNHDVLTNLGGNVICVRCLEVIVTNHHNRPRAKQVSKPMNSEGKRT